MSKRVTAAAYKAGMAAKSVRTSKGRRRDREGPIHKAVLSYLRATFPEAVIHHSPNELAIKGDRAARILSKQKSLGMLPGFPDLMVIYAGRAMGFEVKAKGNYQTDAQKAVQASWEASGSLYAVVRSVDDTRAALAAWGDEVTLV